MAALNLILQTLLVIAWYAVPAMATVPWFVIFLPMLVPAVVLGSVLLFGLVCFVIAAILAAF